MTAVAELGFNDFFFGGLKKLQLSEKYLSRVNRYLYSIPGEIGPLADRKWSSPRIPPPLDQPVTEERIFPVIPDEIPELSI